MNARLTGRSLGTFYRGPVLWFRSSDIYFLRVYNARVIWRTPQSAAWFPLLVLVCLTGAEIASSPRASEAQTHWRDVMTPRPLLARKIFRYCSVRPNGGFRPRQIQTVEGVALEPASKPPVAVRHAAPPCMMAINDAGQGQKHSTRTQRCRLSGEPKNIRAVALVCLLRTK